jgi:hypothetical protein
MSKIDVKYIDTRKYIATVSQSDGAWDSPDTWGNFTMELFDRNGNVDVDDYKDDIFEGFEPDIDPRDEEIIEIIETLEQEKIEDMENE